MSLKHELFGPEKEDVYKNLAFCFEGKYIKGDFYNPVKAEIPYKNWTITADTNVIEELININRGNPYGGNSEYSRLRAPFIRTNDFLFAVTNSNAFSSIAKFFGSQDICIGDDEFDNLFVVKSNDEIKAKLLFSNVKIKELLLEFPLVNFSIRTREGIYGTVLPESVHELFFKTENIILDLDILKLLVALISETLDQLNSMGCAENKNPHIVLD